MSKQLYSILSYYLKKTGISFSKTNLKQMLFSNPEQDTLYAMVDVLDELNTDNIAIRLDMSELRANGFPAIVHYGG